MEFLDKKIQDYSELHTSQETGLLSKINRDTYTDVLAPRMLSGQMQGRILSMFSKVINPQNILEIGTFTGYSAICLSEGLKSGGRLVTIDINEELESRVAGYFSEAGLADIIDYRIGNALDILPQLKDQFQLVFIDADKENYQNYYNLILDKVPSGGIIIADNVLWSGKVLGEHSKKMDKDTQALIDFNDFVQKDERVENVLFPVRDGLMVIRKI
ncbi:O-methyltransferase [Reichenbachiella sp. MALMAid0571]|uniref:O-methyltransferase n=1 Tax=Reichenbachiella sp. MALMAid0571 TaxID=3143939 RepID=UPI0032DF776C